MAIFGTNSEVQLFYRMNRPKPLIEQYGPIALSAAMSWLPSRLEIDDKDPILAYSWDNQLSLVQLFEDDSNMTYSTKKRPEILFASIGEWICPSVIVALRWMTSQVCISILCTLG